MYLTNEYYVYAYLRKSDLTPYYIGKGKGYRAYSKQHPVSVPKDKSKIVILKENLTEIEALNLEKELIEKYGKKINGGLLLNKTDGGVGTSVWKHSEETRIEMSKRITGKNNPNYGKKISDEQKNKMREGYLKTPITEEVREKIRAANLGKKISNETREKFRMNNSGENNPMYGRKHSPESIAKMRAAKLKKLSP